MARIRLDNKNGDGSVLSEEACRDAWSVLTKQPRPHALVVVGLNRRRRWIRTALVLVPFVALATFAFLHRAQNGTAEWSARQATFGVMLGGLGLAMMVVAYVLSSRSGLGAVRGWSPDLALAPAERKVLLDVIARGLVAPPQCQPVVVNVAVRHRHQGWTILNLAGLVVLMAGIWAGDPDFWPLLALAAVLLVPKIIWRGLLAARADRFLRRLPPVAARAGVS